MPEKSRETHSSQSLRFACEQLERLVAVPRRIAEEMDRAGIGTLGIDYQKSLERALLELNRWSKAAEESLLSELYDRGAFKAADPTQSSKSKRKVRKEG